MRGLLGRGGGRCDCLEAITSRRKHDIVGIQSSTQRLDCIANGAGCVEQLGTAQTQILRLARRSGPCKDIRQASTERMVELRHMPTMQKGTEDSNLYHFLVLLHDAHLGEDQDMDGADQHGHHRVEQFQHCQGLAVQHDWHHWHCEKGPCIPRYVGFLGDLE